MAHLVINEKITSGRALVPGQILQIGNFTIGARPAIKPEAVPWIAKNHLRINPESVDKMDPTDISSLNKLLDRIAALEVITDYDLIGLKPDQREISVIAPDQPLLDFSCLHASCLNSNEI